MRKVNAEIIAVTPGCYSAVICCVCTYDLPYAAKHLIPGIHTVHINIQMEIINIESNCIHIPVRCVFIFDLCIFEEIIHGIQTGELVKLGGSDNFSVFE